MSKRGVQYVQNEDPVFLKKFKQRIGYQEGPNVETKKAELPVEDSGSEREDEQPQIVVLKKGDLSQEEVDRVKNKTEQISYSEKDVTGEVPSDGKILFRKPIEKEDGSELNVSTKKLKRKSKTDKLSKQHTNDKIKNKTLLSFNDEEDEDND